MSNIAPTGEDAIHRPPIDADAGYSHCNLGDSQLESVYNVKATCDWIVANNFRVIGLQFPDQLLHHSIPILRSLRTHLTRSNTAILAPELFIMADTTYGSCCVDEVAAKHANVEGVVHYGSACMTSNVTLPVHYVFPKHPLKHSVTQLGESLAEFVNNWIKTRVPDTTPVRTATLRYDIRYHWVINQFFSHVSQSLIIPLVLENIETTSLPALNVKSTQVSEVAPVPLDSSIGQANNPAATIVIYVGGPSRRLNHILLTNPNRSVFALDPDDDAAVPVLQTSSSNKLFGRRYGTIQRARDADTVGIVVGTLNVAGYLEMLDRLHRMLKLYHKKHYTVAVGKLKPEKLANFSDIQCWVLIACPENALLDGFGKDYIAPVVTPWEMEFALLSTVADKGQSNVPTTPWNGNYSLDFAHILGNELGPPLEDENDSDGPLFSTATGTYKQQRKWKNNNQDESSLESMQGQISSEAAALVSIEYGALLATKTFRGLSPRYGEDNPAVMKEGRMGIARGYEEDNLLS